MRIGLALFLIWNQVSANSGFYFELGTGKNGLHQDNWLGREDIGCYTGAGYVRNFGPWALDLSYRHASQCNRGQGYDDRDESTNDSLGLYGRYYFEGED
jgi:hypothetical protein